MIAVQIYIKKNTLVQSGSVTTANPSPYVLVKNSAASYTTNQYKGHYIKITAGTGLGSIAYIVSNTATELTLQTAIPNDTTTQYEIYRADYQKLDLFSDEKISVTSSVANANDIGKIFTDYSQSFTIPASDRNNQILSHWYESCIDNGYDHRQRYDGFIEIDTQRFKDGNFQLEKANKKNGFIESYSVTFYGNLTQLKDKFKDTKLRDLPTGNLAAAYGTDNYWGLYNHPYNSTEVKNRITATTPQSIYYPLIGTDRKYYYKNGIAGQDVTLASAPIKWNELFPAISMESVFGFIQLCFGVTFTGSFFNLDQWKKLHLYLKNAEKLNYNTEQVLVDYTSIASGSFPEINLATNIVNLNWNFLPSGFSDYQKITSDVYVTPAAGFTNVAYTIYIYRDNLLYRSTQCVGNSSLQLDELNFRDAPNVTHNYYIKVSATADFQFSTQLQIQRRYTTFPPSTPPVNTISNAAANSTTQTIAAKIPLVNFVPDITINDFITGVVKAFNLMIIPIDANTFEFIPLEMYYNAGKTLDITKYVYADDMDIERPKLFKAVNFTYEKSSNILNNAYKGLYNKEYGDLIYNNPNSSESANYDIKLPFENILFEKTVNENFLTASLIDKDLKPYTPKPVLIYRNDVQTLSTPVILTTTGSNTTFSTYNRFSNEYNSLPTDLTYSYLMTMNFSNEQSPWYNVLAPKGLYYRHYKNYIDNLYNIKTRIVKVKALFPASLLASTVTDGVGKKLGIALNDRLIIRNKRYIINNMTTDLTTGEASLELITDYRGLNAASSVGYKSANYDIAQVDKTAQDIEVVVYLNDYDSFGVKAATDFLVYSVSGVQEYKDITFTVSVPFNGSGIDRKDYIGIEYYNDGTLAKTEYIFITQTAI